MTREDANDLLDAVRDGAEFDEWLIVDALKATGDVDDVPDYPVVRVRPAGTWELKSRGLAPALWHQVVA